MYIYIYIDNGIYHTLTIYHPCVPWSKHGIWLWSFISQWEFLSRTYESTTYQPYINHISTIYVKHLIVNHISTIH